MTSYWQLGILLLVYPSIFFFLSLHIDIADQYFIFLFLLLQTYLVLRFTCDIAVFHYCLYFCSYLDCYLGHLVITKFWTLVPTSLIFLGFFSCIKELIMSSTSHGFMLANFELFAKSFSWRLEVQLTLLRIHSRYLAYLFNSVLPFIASTPLFQ